MELPDELKELKLRLKFELDSNCIDRVIDEWYEEYQEDYHTLVESVDPIQEQAEKDAE